MAEVLLCGMGALDGMCLPFSLLECIFHHPVDAFEQELLSSVILCYSLMTPISPSGWPVG